MPYKFIKREISWLHFNERVLQEAADYTTPLIERIKFLGIFSNNQDEFFRVRVATLTRMIGFENKNPEYQNFDPEKTLKEIYEIVFNQQKKFISTYNEIVKNLSKENIFIVNENELSEYHGEYVKNYFQKEVRSNLFPIMIENFQQSTSLKDKSIYLAVHLKKKDGSIKDNFALIEVPTSRLSRFLILPSIKEKRYIILLEDLIRYCLNDIFSIFEYDEFNSYIIKFTRDAELDIDNDVSKSFMEQISESLKQRKIGRAVRFIYDRSITDELFNIITKKLKITKKENHHSGGRYHNFKDFMDFPNVGSHDLEYEKTIPLPHKDLVNTKSIISAIMQKDIMLHYPYQSFQYIIDLLREASIDPNVKSIKMTLYRVAKNSKIINALINAARNGKKVTVFLELLARFDEEANIYWSGKLLDEGVKIIHGIQGMKVHSKLILIKRKEENKIVSYGHIGTGNFNEESSEVFADDSLLTANDSITSEIDKVFSLFENNYRPANFRTLIISPFNQRNFFLKMIDNEILNAKEGKDAWTILKLNSLVDETIIRKLYEASNAGVKINIIARGICVLVPRVKGMSENIEVISIVDKFLEHSRAFIFCNNGDEKYYISSADWMTRNFDHRIEVTCPILDKDIQSEIKTILSIQLSDNTKARIISKVFPNQYKKTDVSKKIRSQFEIYNFLKEKANHN